MLTFLISILMFKKPAVMISGQILKKIENNKNKEEILPLL